MMLVPLDGCFVGNTQESVSELLNHLMRLDSGLLVCIHSHLCSVLVFHFCFWPHKKMWKDYQITLLHDKYKLKLKKAKCSLIDGITYLWQAGKISFVCVIATRI